VLIEKLCATELRADKLASAEATVLVAHENDEEIEFYESQFQ